MPGFPKRIVKYKILIAQKPDIEDVQVGLLFDLSDQRLLDTLPQLDVTTRDNVFIPPFVGFHQEQLSLWIEDQRTNGGFRIFLFCHMYYQCFV